MRGIDTYTVQRLYDDIQLAVIDLAVIKNLNISDGAKVLYTYLVGMDNGLDCKEETIANILGLTEDNYLTRKQELINADLLLIEKDAIKGDVMYIGNSLEKASETKDTIESLKTK